MTAPIDSLESERNDVRAELQRRWPNQPCRMWKHLQLPDYSRVREVGNGAWLLSDREGRESVWMPTGLGSGDSQWWARIGSGVEAYDAKVEGRMFLASRAASRAARPVESGGSL